MNETIALALIAMVGVQVGNWVTNYYGLKKAVKVAETAAAQAVEAASDAARAVAEAAIATAKVAVKVADVKDTLEVKTAQTDVKLKNLAIVSEATHTLVNNEKGLLMERYMKLTRLHADSTGNPEDRRVANDAEHAYRARVLAGFDVEKSASPPP